MLLSCFSARPTIAGRENLKMLRAARITLEGVGLFTIIASIVGFVAFFELANLLQYENRPEKADFIFPLAGDAQRLTKAAQLHNAGLASKI